jgi:hypothetical protein
MAKKKAAPKKKKAAAAKRPSRTFEDLLTGYAAPLQDVCRALRGLVQENEPELKEGIYGGAKVGLALYCSAAGKVVCGIQPSGEDCLFYLHYLQPADSARLRLEGQGKHARHIKIRKLDAATRDELSALLRLAVSRS